MTRPDRSLLGSRVLAATVFPMQTLLKRAEKSDFFSVVDSWFEESAG